MPSWVVVLVLFLGDLNTLLVFFFILMSTFLVSTTSTLHLLLTAELLWITLYLVALLVGLAYDNLNVISLTFFFLIFSAAEFGSGLVLILLQQIIYRSLSLYTNEVNVFKFLSKANRGLAGPKLWHR